MTLERLLVSFPNLANYDKSASVQISFGFPLPAGYSAERLANHELFGENGRVEHSKFVPLAHWQDGSIKWVSVDASLSPKDATGTLRLRKLESAKQSEPIKKDLNRRTLTIVPQGLRISRNADTTSASGIDLRFEVNGPSGAFSLIGDAAKLRSDVRELFTQFEVDTSFSPPDLRYPVDVKLRGKAWKNGQIDLACTICNTNPANHPGGNWDLGEKGAVLIDNFSVVITPTDAEPSSRPESVNRAQSSNRIVVRTAVDATFQTASKSLHLFQASSGGKNWKSPTHVVADGSIPLPFCGYRLKLDDKQFEGLRATPYVALQNGAQSIGLAVRRFWENFPCAIRSDGSCIDVALFPKESGYPHELQGGEQKTFELAIYEGEISSEDAPLDGYLLHPIPVFRPDYIEGTTAVKDIVARTAEDPATVLYESIINQAIDGKDTFVDKREAIDEYGWRNFGDVYSDHEAVFQKGPSPLVAHLNNQYDCAWGFAIQFLRSGDPRWFEQMIDMANHAWDIDTYHTTQDRHPYNLGLHWHTFHYANASTGTHRGYPKTLLVEELSAEGADLDSMGSTGKSLKKVYGKGGGPSSSHMYSTGWMVAYYLTGEPRYKEAAINLANYALELEDGSQTRFRLLSSRPTGYATSSSYEYYGPGRASGNAIHVLLTGYELTGEAKYIEMVNYLMRRCVHPDQDLDSLDLLNAELRWFYTMHLQAQCRLIDLLETIPGQEENHKYAVACLLHYARWMLKNERPTLDHPEHLQYPTETWAAQDIRKWHVLAYAARWCPTRDEGSAMMQKADWFYDYVMRTLDGFPTKSLCRPVVLLMVCGWQRESLRRDFDRLAPTQIQLPTQWPEQQPFIPQRREAIARAKKIILAGGVLGLVSIAALGWVVINALWK
jgi:hypothetical protein